MNKYKIQIDNYTTLTRISKSLAKKVYENNLDVLFIPHKLNPANNFYNMGIWENKKSCGQYETFEKLCDYYEIYNCKYETGYYIAFYIPLCWIDKFSGNRVKDLYKTEHYNHLQAYDLEYRNITKMGIA